MGVQLNAIDHTPGSFVPGLAMHLAYLNFGRASVRSLAAPDGGDGYYGPNGHDGYYSPTAHSCVGPCGPLRSFVSGGTMQAVALTVEPFWTYRKWRFGIEAGPTVFRSTYDATATAISDSQWWNAGQVETFHHTPKWEAGALVGAAVSYGAVSLRYNYIFAKTHTYNAMNVPPGWSGAHMLTLNYTF
ncbi:hypothetical protein [Paraburkholderia piptadeniae]|uniref:hypothetical protein n=1 Tax=Paraburkholderia piptadeniae TaxID=1701573 RepID=UPI001180A482|nr:hypothetical protein [Paraburkholderia piptadeniae]